MWLPVFCRRLYHCCTAVALAAQVANVCLAGGHGADHFVRPDATFDLEALKEANPELHKAVLEGYRLHLRHVARPNTARRLGLGDKALTLQAFCALLVDVSTLEV